MANNRHLIIEPTLVSPPQLLDKGLPIPVLRGRYMVDEGWCAVITVGGAFKEILEPGQYYLDRYSMWQDAKAIRVDRRIKTLTVSTTREFTIAQPVPIEINLDLSVEYRVADPRRVALEMSTPLTSLFDRVIQAMRSAVVYATIDEIRTQGEGLARAALHRLQALQLPSTIGLEVLNVMVTTIKATDAGSDALAAQQMKEFSTIRDWQLDSMMLQGSRVTPEWLMMHRPEIYQQILAGNQAILKELIDKGLLDPASFLAQRPGAVPFDASGMLGNLGLPGAGTTQSGGTVAVGAPQLGAGPSRGQSTSGDIHARMREEIGYLEKLPGAKVQTKPGTDGSGIPDGSYDLKVDMPRSSGGMITLFFECPTGYPNRSPVLAIDVDGQAASFQSAVLRRWTGQGQYLVEIAREVKQYFG